MPIRSQSFSRSKLGFVVDTDGTASGLNVNPNANMVLDVEAGSFWLGGKYVTISATTVTISAADPSLGRIDVVHVDDAGSVQVIAGNPDASPTPPQVRDDVLLLAQVTVAAGATSIAAASIQDLRDISFFTVSLSPPIGSIIAWDKTLTGTPALPAGWVECAGQTISDADSPYDGVAIRNLQGGRRFLAGNTTSGGTGAFDFVVQHNHTATDSGHTHTIPRSNAFPDAAMRGYNEANTNYTLSSGTASITVDNSAAAGTNWNFTNMVYIMRIK